MQRKSLRVESITAPEEEPRISKMMDVRLVGRISTSIEKALRYPQYVFAYLQELKYDSVVKGKAQKR